MRLETETSYDVLFGDCGTEKNEVSISEGQLRLTFGCVQRRECATTFSRQEEKRKTAEKIHGFSKRGHADGWCYRGAY